MADKVPVVAWPTDPVDRALMESDQRRSWVRAEPPYLDPGDVLATEVRRLRAAMAENDAILSQCEAANNKGRASLSAAQADSERLRAALDYLSTWADDDSDEYGAVMRKVQRIVRGEGAALNPDKGADHGRN